MTDERMAFTLSFPARAEYIVLCRLGVAALARLATLDAESVDDLKLAVTEACTNVVQHAYGDGCSEQVDVTYESNADVVRVAIEDTGVGYRRGVALASDNRDGGMGLAIIRSLMDEVELAEGAGGRGTRVSLAKRR